MCVCVCVCVRVCACVKMILINQILRDRAVTCDTLDT